MSYSKYYSEWAENPLSFWDEKAKDVSWIELYKKTLHQSDNYYEWFHQGKLNTCYNCVDKHVENGKSEKVAIIYDSPITNTKKKITYIQLLEKVSSLAASLSNIGVEKGDRVILYMPMIPEVIVSMLACARIGAIHSVVFGGFAAEELASRISDVLPKVIISASCGLETKRIIDYKEILDKALSLTSHKPLKQIIYQREQHLCKLNSENYISWNEFV